LRFHSYHSGKPSDMRFAAVSLFAWLASASVAAAESASVSVTVTASFASRTSLDVSTKLLHFDVVDPGSPATAAVDFNARARTQSGGEVVLAVETARSVSTNRSAGKRNHAATTVETITFEGTGAGTTSGVIGSASPAVAGRWTGSGVRAGQLIFTMYAPEAGSYSVPLRFVLTAP
jgi:hypothetical protein